jgi:hypothetical protein
MVIKIRLKRFFDVLALYQFLKFFVPFLYPRARGLPRLKRIRLPVLWKVPRFVLSVL